MQLTAELLRPFFDKLIALRVVVEATGIKTQRISQIRCCSISPSVEEVDLIAKAFGTTRDVVLDELSRVRERRLEAMRTAATG